MTTQSIRILHPVTGELIRQCRGPTESGVCPLAGPGGVVPCAGMMIAAAEPDPGYWPIPIPRGYRHCDLPWNEKIRSCLRKSEHCRRRWQSGLKRETLRIRTLARYGDPRYRKMTERELDITALWYWRLTVAAKSLRRAEERAQHQAKVYLDLTEYRRSLAGSDVSAGPDPSRGLDPVPDGRRSSGVMSRSLGPRPLRRADDESTPSGIVQIEGGEVRHGRLTGHLRPDVTGAEDGSGREKRRGAPR